jgi:tetratricopeptide (TPR) repeat protein
MIDTEKLKYIITEIYGNHEYDLTKRILDFFKEKCEESDYAGLRDICELVNYFELELKLIQYLYSRTSDSNQLFRFRTRIAKLNFNLNKIEEALFYNSINLKISPDDFETLSNRSLFLNVIGNYKESEAILRQLEPTNSEEKNIINAELGKHLIRNGDLDNGVKAITKQFRNLHKEHVNHEYWDGVPRPGRTIIVCGDGGIGDEFAYFRFFGWLKKLGMNPILYSTWIDDRSDVDIIFKRHGIEVTNSPTSFEKDYLWVNLLALPGLCNLSEENLWSGPYIIPANNEKNKIQNDTNFKIGIKTQGDPSYSLDAYRTIPINDLINSIPKDSNITIYCFDEPWVQDTISDENKNRVKNVWVKNWDNTIDLISQMDLVISSCTGFIHASGAIGKQSIIITSLLEHFIWTSSRTDESTPWYGENLKVIRQVEPRSWNSPLTRVKQLVEEYSKK